MLKKIHQLWQKTSWKKRLMLFAAIGVVVILLFRSTQGSSSPTYQFATVSKDTITQMVSETGEISSSNRTDVSTSINGVVSEVFVKNGDTVKRGDKLFYVQSSASQAERSQASASYLSAKNNLESAKIKLYTLESAMWTAHDNFKSKALDPELSVDDPMYIETNRDWLAGEATYLQQKQVITQAQAALNSAWLEYQATLDGPVLATTDGQVANIGLAPGQTVQAADTALVISSPGDAWVKVGINENDISSVQPGQTATIQVDALPNAILKATVERVDDFATIVSDVAVYYVYLKLDNTNQSVRPGMTAQVDITTQERSNVLVVPNTAIKPYQGEKAVQVFDADSQTVIYQPVVLGIAGDSVTEVVSGLQEGEKIIVSSSASTTKNQSGGFLFRPPGG